MGSASWLEGERIQDESLVSCELNGTTSSRGGVANHDTQPVYLTGASPRMSSTNTAPMSRRRPAPACP